MKNFAQNRDYKNWPDRYFKFDYFLGVNIDVPPSYNHTNAYLLGRRSGTALSLTWKGTYLFSKKLGGYAALRIDFYQVKKPKFYEQSVLEETFENLITAFLGPLSFMNGTADAGLVYRMERGRWSLYPSIGLGASSYGANESFSDTTKNAEGHSETLAYKKDVSFMIAALGLSANYRAGRKSVLSLNAGFQLPLQSSSASYVKKIDGVENARAEYRTSAAGRNIFIGLSYAVIIGRLKRKD